MGNLYITYPSSTYLSADIHYIEIDVHLISGFGLYLHPVGVLRYDNIVHGVVEESEPWLRMGCEYGQVADVGDIDRGV